MKNQPNILVICSDQHNAGMTGYSRHPHVKTPNLDRLANGGCVFTRGYCTSPICTPSRMSFITGKYVHQLENWTIGVPLPESEMTWGRKLDLAGIESTMLGKMDFCGEYQDGGFTHHKILRKREAFKSIPLEEPYIERLDGFIRKDKKVHLEMAGTRSESIISDGGFTGEAYDLIGNYDHDRIITNYTLDYIRRKGLETDKKPWACFVGLLMPHWPFCVPEKYFNMYYPDKVELPKDFKIPNENLHPAVRHFQSALDIGTVKEESIRRVIAAYYGMITCLDDLIGEILDELENQGLMENTRIIYTSDHGESLGEHGLFYKQCSYEGSVAVPLIMHGPEIPSGKVIDQPVSLVDMYPTIMDMAGLDIENDRPGKSWLSLVKEADKTSSGYAFAEFHGNLFKQDWYMIAEKDFKYTWYSDGQPSLFNLKDDLGELHDLAQDIKYQHKLEYFENILKKILEPEQVSFKAKFDLGLIGKNGEDYTRVPYNIESGKQVDQR